MSRRSQKSPQNPNIDIISTIIRENKLIDRAEVEALEGNLRDIQTELKRAERELSNRHQEIDKTREKKKEVASQLLQMQGTINKLKDFSDVLDEYIKVINETKKITKRNFLNALEQTGDANEIISAIEGFIARIRDSKEGLVRIQRETTAINEQYQHMVPGLLDGVANYISMTVSGNYCEAIHHPTYARSVSSRVSSSRVGKAYTAYSVASSGISSRTTSSVAESEVKMNMLLELAKAMARAGEEKILAPAVIKLNEMIGNALLPYYECDDTTSVKSATSTIRSSIVAPRIVPKGRHEQSQRTQSSASSRSTRMPKSSSASASAATAFGYPSTDVGSSHGSQSSIDSDILSDDSQDWTKDPVRHRRNRDAKTGKKPHAKLVPGGRRTRRK